MPYAALLANRKNYLLARENTHKRPKKFLAIQRELTAELRRQQTVLNMVNKEQIDIAKHRQTRISTRVLVGAMLVVLPTSANALIHNQQSTNRFVASGRS